MIGFLIRRVLQAIVVVFWCPADRLPPGPDHSRRRGPGRARHQGHDGQDPPVQRPERLHPAAAGTSSTSTSYGPGHASEPGVLLLLQPDGVAAHLRQAPEDARPGGILDPLGPGHLHPLGHPAGRPAQQADRLRAHRAVLHLLRHARFLLGTLLILYFAIDLNWFPRRAAAEPTVGEHPLDPRALVLPVLTLAALTIASFSRYMRSSMMEAHDRGLRPHGPGQGGRARAGCSTSTPCATP